VSRPNNSLLFPETFLTTPYNEPVILETESKLPVKTFVTRLFTPLPTPPTNSFGPFSKPFLGSLKNSNTPVPNLSTKPTGLPNKSLLPKIL
jgi:hypothetical protein